MPRNRRAIPWWIYLALAVISFVACGAGYEFARQWVEGIPAAESAFAHTFLVNFLGVLRIALPLFFLVLGILSVVVPRRAGRPAKSADAASAASSNGSAKAARSRFTSVSEAVGVNYGLLRCMEWRRFEIVCAEYLRCLNYEVLETGFGSRDTVDLEVFLPGKGELMSVVKCIADEQPVDVGAVRDFLETMKRRRVGEGMMFAVCGFTHRAERFATRHRIALVGGETLCSRIRGLEAESQAALVSVATAGDYTTPTCPACGVKLVLRRRTGSASGRREFWGCMNFPRCQVTIPLS